MVSRGRAVFPWRESEVARIQHVVAEIFLDLLSLISEQEHEIFEALRVINFHYVPENRPIADPHQGLRNNFRLLLESSSPSTAKDDDGYILGERQFGCFLHRNGATGASSSKKTVGSTPLETANMQQSDLLRKVISPML